MNRLLNLTCCALTNRTLKRTGSAIADCASRRLLGRACLLPLLAALLCPLVVPAQAQRSTKYGQGALNSSSADGNDNSAFGYEALYSNTTGFDNTASG